MIFERLKIMEAGVTTNYATQDGKTLPYRITQECLSDLVALGNEKPIHCRRTHNGEDMLDGYLGKFTNFVLDGSAVYADFEMSESLAIAYPAEAKFIESMILNEPDMLGISVVACDIIVENEGYFDVAQFTDLYACDIVGLPAATKSLFNNEKASKMNKFFSAFASAFKAKTKLATEVIPLTSGGTITVEAEGEEMAVGDKVFDSEGNEIPDGEYEIEIDDMVAILVVADGAVAEVKATEVEMTEEEEEEKSKEVPEEFSNRLAAIETKLADLLTKFSAKTKTPTESAVKMPAGKTKLSKEAVKEAAAKYMKK
nr:MAG TPA: hypothetical protein [Caudoviricetes sp.]